LSTAIAKNEDERSVYVKNCDYLTDKVFNKELIIGNLLELLKRG